MIRTFWKSLGPTARGGFLAGVVLIAAATAVAGYWLLHTEYQVLFADLTPQDAATMAAELERQKIPFTVGEPGIGGGTAILVDKKDVHRTRLKLMGRDIPLHGAVGFELFNNSDFGMTEFAQKINYQRALQGELTRTILSLSEIRDARVLLALPEQGLFKQAVSKAKASVTLTLKPGQTLRSEQVTGIQRLVAAAVAGIATQDVTIVDQSGVALTRVAGDGEVETNSIRLDLKRDTENYLARKAGDVLERALGAGEALASVDVTLDMDRVQTTTEDVTAAPAKTGRAPTGIVVRERETTRELGAPLSTRIDADTGGGSFGGSSQREVEYAVGRRVAQVMSQPGSIRRIQVVAVVRKALDPGQQEQIRKMVAASVGASVERGDTVVVQSMEAVQARAGSYGVSAGSTVGRETAEVSGPIDAMLDQAKNEKVRTRVPALVLPQMAIVLVSSMVVAMLIGFWILVRYRRRKTASEAPAGTPPPLSDAQRKAALVQVRAWMRSDGVRRPSGEVS